MSFGDGDHVSLRPQGQSCWLVRRDSGDGGGHQVIFEFDNSPNPARSQSVGRLDRPVVASTCDEARGNRIWSRVDPDSVEPVKLWYDADNTMKIGWSDRRTSRNSVRDGRRIDRRAETAASEIRGYSRYRATAGGSVC